MATSSDQLHGHDYVDFDEYIDIQLKKTGSTIKATDVLTAVVGILTLVTLYLFLFVVFDHWIVPGGFGAVTRGIMLAVVASGTCAWLVLKVIVPWRRRVSGLYAASTIEKASPALKSSLLNLVDISRSQHPVSPEIYNSIEKRAALALTHVDVNETVDRRSLLRLSNVLLAVVVLFCLYWVFSPKNPATSLWRAIVPSADVGVATRTEIFNVRPGDKDVLARSQLEVTADVRGEIPAQTALYFTTADRKFVDERVEMRLENESTRKFRCVLTGDNGGGILQNMTYRIVAGDAATPEYAIRVIQPPAATIESIRLDSPAYTRREPVVQTTGAIDALEGTRVTLKARANMPLRSNASLQFFDDETASKRAEEIPIRVTDGTKLETEWKLEIRSDGTYPHYYRLFCTNAAGESDPAPSLYSLAIRPDQPPEITLRDPKTDLDLPANAVLPLVIEARDPDFALTYIDLNIEKDGSPVNGPPIYSERNDQEFKTTYKWKLRDYHFRPRETVTYWLQAKDNRQPIANLSRTPKLRIRITNPVPEEQVQKELQLAEQRQKEEMKKSQAEQAAQEKPDDDNAAREAKPKEQQRPERPKEHNQLAARQQQPDQQKARQNERPDEQNRPDQNTPEQKGRDRNETGQKDSGQKGPGQQPDKGEPGQAQNGEKDTDSAGEGRNGNQKLNPDNPADDPKALQKLLDQERRDEEKKNSSSTERPASQEQDEQKKDEEQKPDKTAASQDQKEKNESGSPSESSQNRGKPGEKKSGEADQQAKQDDSSATKSSAKQSREQNGESKGTQKRDDANNPSSARRETKEQAAPSGSQKPQSNGSDERGERSQQLNKEGQNGQAAEKPKAGPQTGSPKPEKTEQKNAKNGSAEGPRDSQEKRDKTAGRRDDTPSDGKRADQSQRPDSQQESRPKDSGSRNESTRPDQQPDRTPDANQPPGGQRKAADASNEKNGQQKKNEGTPQNGNEAGKEQQKDRNNQDGSSRSQPQKSSGQPASRENGDESNQKEKAKKEPAENEAGTKQRRQSDSADNQEERGERSSKKNADQPRDGAGQPQRNQKPRPDDAKTKGKATNDDNQQQTEKTDNSDVKPNESGTRPKARPDDRRRNNTVEEQSRPDNPKDTDEPPNTIKSKKHAPKTGLGDSEIGPSADSQEAGSRKDAAGQKGSPQKNAGQKGSSPSEQKTAAEQQARSKEQSAGQQKSGGQKEEGQKSGEPKSGQPGHGQQGQSGQGKQGNSGQGQQGEQGKGQQGKNGAKGEGTKGQQAGAGTGQSSSGKNGGGFNNGTGNGEGAPLEDTTKQANLDYAKKATDLVLQHLENQLKRGKVDKKVEEELGWTQDQIRRFVDRMRRQTQAAEDPNSPAAEARRLQFEETLKSLNIGSRIKSRSSQAVPKTNDAEMESKRSIPPPEYRDLYNAFTKSLSKPASPPPQENK